MTPQQKRVILFSGGVSLVDPQAQAFYNRVIADGGVVPTGLVGVSATFKAIKAIYGVTDITAAISVFYDAHYLAYKLGTGTGVTLGQACAKLYSACGASGDCVQATLASQPLLLAHSGVNYWFGSGVSGNYCSTPNAAANQITGDIEIIVNVNYVNNLDFQVWVSKDTSYNLYVNASNLLVLNFGAATSSVGIGASYNGYIKATRQASSGDVKFYTSSDGITYTQLGTTRPTAAGNLTNSSNIVYVAAHNTTTLTIRGKLFRATISNTIGGSPVVDFNPASYNAATSQTSWISATSETWTINTGTATTGYKGVLVDRTVLQGDKVDDVMDSVGNFSFNSNASIFIASRQFINTVFNVIASYGTGGSDYASWYNETADRNFIDYNSGTSKSKGFTGQGVLITLNSYITTSNTFEVFKNNASQGSSTSAAVPSVTASPIRLFKLAGVSSYGNLNLTTFILCPQTSDSTQRTAMYNAIKLFNNNAF